jgi:hypothetical protein
MSALVSACLIDIPELSTKDQVSIKYSGCLREVVQKSLFSDRYYKRIAHLATLAILFWDKKLLESIKGPMSHEKSVYASSFYQQLCTRFMSIRSRNDRNIAIASSLRTYRYPLDGIRFDREIGLLRERFPELKSLIRERFT